MVWRVLMIAVVAAALNVCGCKEKPAEPAEVKITEETLDSELDKMEAEIEADIATEQ